MEGRDREGEVVEVGEAEDKAEAVCLSVEEDIMDTAWLTIVLKNIAFQGLFIGKISTSGMWYGMINNDFVEFCIINLQNTWH